MYHEEEKRREERRREKERGGKREKRKERREGRNVDEELLLHVVMDDAQTESVQAPMNLLLSLPLTSNETFRQDSKRLRSFWLEDIRYGTQMLTPNC